MSQNVGSDPPKRTRVWRPRAKSGCVTCKERHVKCDELKPACRQCSRVKRTCGGYEEAKKQSSVRRSAILLSKGEPYIPPSYQPLAPRFKDSQEDFCFRHFCNTTSTFLSGPWESDLWNRLIPQVSESYPSIRHAVIAIAALSLISRTQYQAPEKERIEIYHQFSLQQYSKALAQMRSETGEGIKDLRLALIACILNICFETYYGNLDSALNQLGAGLGLINTWFERNNLNSGTSTTKTMFAPHVVEEELIQVYGRLGINAMMLQRSRPVRGFAVMAKSATAETDPIPNHFKSVDESRTSFSAILRRLLDVMSLAGKNIVVQQQQSSKDVLDQAPSPAFLEREILLGQLVEWKKAFDPILQRARSEGRKSECRAALILHLHYLTTYFITSSLPSKKPMQRREHMPLFTEIISQSRLILHQDDGAINLFVLDVETIKPLYMVASYCPNITLRRQAISMLLSVPRREGFWDAILCGKVAQWVTTLEEIDIEGEYLPEETRVLRLSIDADLQKRTARVQCLKPEKGDSRHLLSKTTTIDW